jgi:hypothetical protein
VLEYCQASLRDCREVGAVYGHGLCGQQRLWGFASVDPLFELVRKVAAHTFPVILYTMEQIGTQVIQVAGFTFYELITNLHFGLVLNDEHNFFGLVFMGIVTF